MMVLEIYKKKKKTFQKYLVGAAYSQCMKNEKKEQISDEK